MRKVELALYTLPPKRHQIEDWMDVLEQYFISHQITPFFGSTPVSFGFVWEWTSRRAEKAQLRTSRAAKLWMRLAGEMIQRRRIVDGPYIMVGRAELRITPIKQLPVVKLLFEQGREG